MELTGTVKLKRDEQVVNDRFKKREFVLTVDDNNYQQHILFTLTQDRCSLIDKVNEGDTITVAFNIKGREWKSPKDNEVRYFTTLEAWKISKGAAGAGAEHSSMDRESYNPIPSGSGNDDLPF